MDSVDWINLSNLIKAARVIKNIITFYNFVTGAVHSLVNSLVCGVIVPISLLFAELNNCFLFID